MSRSRLSEQRRVNLLISGSIYSVIRIMSRKGFYSWHLYLSAPLTLIAEAIKTQLPKRSATITMKTVEIDDELLVWPTHEAEVGHHNAKSIGEWWWGMSWYWPSHQAEVGHHTAESTREWWWGELLLSTESTRGWWWGKLLLSAESTKEWWWGELPLTLS